MSTEPAIDVDPGRYGWPWMTSVKRFEPRAASSADWMALHTYRRARGVESRAEEPYEPDALAELHMKREQPREIAERLLAWDGGVVTGMADVWIPRPGSPGFESNRGIFWFGLYVLRDYRGRGTGRALFEQLVEVAERHEGRLLGTNTEEADGQAALLAYGFGRKSEARYSRLALETVDWEQLRAWAAEGRQRSPDRQLRLFLNAPPADELETYSRAMTELINTIPWDDIDHGEIVFTPETVTESAAHHQQLGGVMHRYVVYEPDGRMTAVTEMLHLPASQPEHAHQWLTAVHRSAQGNGIGRWIKSEMLLHIHEAFPRVRWILTDNASSNSHMLKINTELGFRPYRVETTYQASVDELRRRAISRG